MVDFRRVLRERNTDPTQQDEREEVKRTVYGVYSADGACCGARKMGSNVFHCVGPCCRRNGSKGK